ERSHGRESASRGTPSRSKRLNGGRTAEAECILETEACTVVRPPDQFAGRRRLTRERGFPLENGVLGRATRTPAAKKVVRWPDHLLRTARRGCATCEASRSTARPSRQPGHRSATAARPSRQPGRRSATTAAPGQRRPGPRWSPSPPV